MIGSRMNLSLSMALGAIFIMLFVQDCTVRRKALIPVPDQMVRDSLKIDFETDCPESKRLKVDENGTCFMFFEEFDDTLSMFADNIHVQDWFIHKRNNPFTSSGYSGITYKFLYKSKKERVRFVLLKNHRYVEFDIDRRFPLYTVQRYHEIWYINGNRCSLDLR